MCENFRIAHVLPCFIFSPSSRLLKKVCWNVSNSTSSPAGGSGFKQRHIPTFFSLLVYCLDALLLSRTCAMREFLVSYYLLEVLIGNSTISAHPIFLSFGISVLASSFLTLKVTS